MSTQKVCKVEMIFVNGGNCILHVPKKIYKINPELFDFISSYGFDESRLLVKSEKGLRSFNQVSDLNRWLNYFVHDETDLPIELILAETSNDNLLAMYELLLERGYTKELGWQGKWSSRSKYPDDIGANQVVHHITSFLQETFSKELENIDEDFLKCVAKDLHSTYLLKSSDVERIKPLREVLLTSLGEHLVKVHDNFIQAFVHDILQICYTGKSVRELREESRQKSGVAVTNE